MMYLLPSTAIVDQGIEFTAEFKTTTQANYGIQVKLITSKQINSILERAHCQAIYHTCIQSTELGIQ